MGTAARYLQALRALALPIILFACYALAGGIIGQQPSTDADTGATAGILLVVCILNASVMAYIILRSRWSGWRLMLAIFVVYYGVTTFMGQIESAVFITRLPPGLLPRLFLAGAAIALPFSILAVIVLGKRKGDSEGTTSLPRDWPWRLGVLAVAYVILYFSFGYFIAWQSPAVREYYGGVDHGGFFAHMRFVVSDTPWLVPFQLLRGLLWTAIALPVIAMMTGRRTEIALALGLLFAVVMNSQLLLPNPYMPEPVRMAHLIETASSNFIFGWLVGWILTRPCPATPPS